MNQTLLGILFTAALATSHAAEPLKQFVPGEIWPDNNGVHINAHGGGILFHDSTYYWFGQHMVAGDAGNVAQVGVSVYSSKDLYNWKNDGIAFKVSEDPKDEIRKGCVLERPKVLYNKMTRMFVMWFHFEEDGSYNTAQCAVAVADKVTGPYKFVARMRPNAGFWPLNVPEEEKKLLSPEEQTAFAPMRFNGGPDTFRASYLILRAQHADGQMARDMSAFVDDDGKAYLVFASEHNGTLHLSELDDTYTKHVGKYIRIEPMGINESPTIFKHDGRYYMITSRCNGWAPSDARLFTAKSIMGPWEFLGNPCVGPEERRKVTFDTQSTHILPVEGKKDAFIFMADRWRPENAIDGRHVWLPIEFDKTGKPFIQWRDKWDLGFFDARTESAAVGFSDNGRAMKLAAPGMDGFVSGFSATVEIGGVRKVLSSADGVPAKAVTTTTEQTPYGAAKVAVSTVNFPAEKLSLELRVGQVKDVPGVLVQPVLHNRGTKPVNLVSLAAVDMPSRASALNLPREGDMVWLIPQAATSIREGHGQCQSGFSTGGKPISIGGKTFSRGLGTHAHSEIEIPLGGAFTRFQASVGADDEIDGGSVGFEVLVDGQKRFESGVMRKGDAAKVVDVDVSGANSLRLVVTDGGDGITCDHADWADACLKLDPAVKPPAAVQAKLALPGSPGEWLVTAYDQSTNGGGANYIGTLAELANGLKVREYGSIYRKDGTGIFFGPVGEPLAYLENRVSASKDGAVVQISSEMSGVRVDPGESRPGQQAVLLIEPPRQALARWAEWVAKTHGARTDKGALAGWCSWYHLTSNIKDSDVMGIVDAVKKEPARLRPQVIQIDDGYQDLDGKWDANAKFPQGMPYYAERIAETGARPGLWMAMTMIGVKHPWLKDSANMEAVWGKAFRKESGFRPDETGWIDPTHPRAIEHITGRIRHAVDSGFTYLKLDFNNIGNGGWYEKKKTTFQILREHYQRMRKAAGENTYILACMTEPNRAVLGLVDAHRDSHDAHRGGVRSAVNDALRSYQLNGQWFAIDNDIYYIAPDVNEVGGVQGGWNLHRTWLSMMGLSGGAALTSDPWHWAVLKPHLRTVEIMQPPAKMRSEVLDLGTAKDWPCLTSVINRPWGDSLVALLWNPAEQAQSITLELAEAGLDPARVYAVWSFWDNKFLGTAKGTWSTPSLDGWACQHLVFTPIAAAANAPVLIGSNLHISSGVAEIKSVTTSTKGIQISFTDAGARDGRLFFHSTKPLKLVQAGGLEAGQVEAAGENVWALDVRARQSNGAQILKLAVP